MAKSEYEHKFAPTSDRPEMAENKRHTEAMKLLGVLMTDFSHTDFTLDDLRDSFNDSGLRPTSEYELSVRFGEKTLKYLVDRNMVLENGDGSYSLNHNSMELAQRAMADDDTLAA